MWWLTPRIYVQKLHTQTVFVWERIWSHWYFLCASIQGLKDHIKKNKEWLTTAAINSIDNINTDRNATITKKQKWEWKQLHGYFKRQTGEIAKKKQQHMKIFFIGNWVSSNRLDAPKFHLKDTYFPWATLLKGMQSTNFKPHQQWLL